MHILLFILAVLAFLAGCGILANAQSAIHEIEGFVLFLIAAVLLSGAAVVEAVKKLPKNSYAGRKLAQRMEELPLKPPKGS